MPTIETLITVIIAGFLISASPGPSMFYVLSRTVAQNSRAGFASAFGLALGGILLAIGSALGLAVIFEYSTNIFKMVQLAGAIYLFYLGWKMFCNSKKSSIDVKEVKVERFTTIIYQGVLVELLNPKTILFFLSFLPAFVDYTRDDVTTQMMILGMLVPLTAIPSDIIVSVVGGTLTQKISNNPAVAKLLNLIASLILFGLSIRLIFMIVQ